MHEQASSLALAIEKQFFRKSWPVIPLGLQAYGTPTASASFAGLDGVMAGEKNAETFLNLHKQNLLFGRAFSGFRRGTCSPSKFCQAIVP
jgi:hypothetical protein